MQSRPINSMIAIGLSLLPLPTLKLLDHFNRGCGDGLCGFFSGILLLGGLATVTLIFILRSARRHETPNVLRLVPLALWVVLLVPLVR